MGDSSSEGESYGPQLLSTATKRNSKDSKEEEEEDDCYVPALPPHMRKEDGRDNTNTHGSEESEDESEEYCPALPPHMLQGGSKRPTIQEPPQRRSLVGPMLPKGFIQPQEDPLKEGEEKEEEEEEEEEEDEGLMIGPLPPTNKVNPEEYRAQELEERARRMRDKLEGRVVSSSKAVVRESWMMELPEDKPNFCGLGPRQFLRKTPTEKGDRSCWTDTPADRARKAEEQNQNQKEKSTPEDDAITQRDKELTEKVDEYNKAKRAKPLVDLHRKELKRKQSAEGPKERRPFSREEDLNVNKFDDAQRETIMKKARQLNDRFSAGKAKFL